MFVWLINFNVIYSKSFNAYKLAHKHIL